ncbi:MAG: hypothetical protein AB3N17_18100 [Tateyamaria sp.]
MPVFNAMRRGCAFAIMCAGLSVGIAMQAAGGDLARHLPDAPLFLVSSAAGAALAGLLLADGFGRSRWTGHLVGALSSVAATLVGAWFGAFIALAWVAMRNVHATLFDALESAPVLGFIAVADGLSTSVPVVVTWVLAMTSVQLWMCRRRGATVT